MAYELQTNENSRASVAYNALQNTIEAVRLRARGYTVPQIAETLHVTPATVSSYLREALKRISSQDIEAARGLELSRLDAIQNGIWDKAVDGDLRAIDRILSISKRRSELLGLDRKLEKEAQDSGPKTLVIEAFKPTEDGIVSPSSESVALDT